MYLLQTLPPWLTSLQLQAASLGAHSSKQGKIHKHRKPLCSCSDAPSKASYTKQQCLLSFVFLFPALCLGMLVSWSFVLQALDVPCMTHSIAHALACNQLSPLSDCVQSDCPTTHQRVALLCSWNQETTAARQEVARTRRALKDIQANIAHVQAAAAADESALEAATAAARLDDELEQQLERLAAAMLRQQAALQRQFTAAQQQEQELQVKICCSACAMTHCSSHLCYHAIRAGVGACYRATQLRASMPLKPHFFCKQHHN
jgi:hypothetical protein